MLDFRNSQTPKMKITKLISKKEENLLKKYQYKLMKVGDGHQYSMKIRNFSYSTRIASKPQFFYEDIHKTPNLEQVQEQEIK
mmetsp:Transcript_13592/g.12061  ORF Transcript_13592/g.12061 Transcript_13592/m.12061 type:complete len:82 (-) Transcript_13592:74-319(-)